jgi:hypothetical protein
VKFTSSIDLTASFFVPIHREDGSYNLGRNIRETSIHDNIKSQTTDTTEKELCLYIKVFGVEPEGAVQYGTKVLASICTVRENFFYRYPSRCVLTTVIIIIIIIIIIYLCNTANTFLIMTKTACYH